MRVCSVYMLVCSTALLYGCAGAPLPFAGVTPSYSACLLLPACLPRCSDYWHHHLNAHTSAAAAQLHCAASIKVEVNAP